MGLRGCTVPQIPASVRYEGMAAELLGTHPLQQLPTSAPLLLTGCTPVGLTLLIPHTVYAPASNSHA